MSRIFLWEGEGNLICLTSLYPREDKDYEKQKAWLTFLPQISCYPVDCLCSGFW